MTARSKVQNICLSQLVLSPANVRKTPATTAEDAALEASIRAKGILQRDLALTEEQAYLTLQRQSRQKRKAMKEIAEAVVLSDELRGNSASVKLT